MYRHNPLRTLSERLANHKLFVNAKWANDERFVNDERKRTLNGERKTVNCERTVNDEHTLNAWWPGGERTVSERWANAKMGK